MKLTHARSGKSLAATDLLVVLCPEGARPALPDGVRIPPAAREDFKGGFRQVRLTDSSAGAARRVALIGLGPKKSVDAERLRRAAAIAVRKAESIGAASATILVAPAVAKLGGGERECGCAVAEGAVMGAYDYQLGKSRPKRRKLARVRTLAEGAAFARGAKEGALSGDASCFARDLQNQAGNQVTPTVLAAEARKLARSNPRVSCRVLDEAAMKKLGMGLLLGVSAGSRQPARLIHLTYRPKGKSKGRVALVGKGLTFDAGGISLKPSARMEDMRYDMSGAAAVLGAFRGISAGIDVPCEVHGIVPASENLPDGLATKPGDVHRAMNGTTVEVINTDAEGRLILGDALAYTTKKVKPDTIIDLATLTGAVVVGLGHEVTGMFATTNRLRDGLSAAGEATGERVWPLPLLEGHKENLRGGPADLRNICTANLGGGSIAGAAFLSAFVGDVEWAHLDIAGTAWGQHQRDYVGGKGGSGVGTRLLIRYLLSRV
ncbi:MAG: leucyl aminopeptidase [Planctomycetes bacterium]|jgi:leucyl aminopeptidase|nr:leucyl aminopeptidase [Planctomycetota bacterium]MDP6407786.1 leucyl aminopeptidase [Planctomycetota bacterium]